MTITIKDETFAGKVLNEITLQFQSEVVTVRDIITSRVAAEVERYNAKANGFFNGLVEPSDSEKTLNGYKLKPMKIIDAEKQVYVALEAFQKNAYFILVDNVQYESLDHQVLLSPGTAVSFVKLTPLVGG